MSESSRFRKTTVWRAVRAKSSDWPTRHASWYTRLDHNLVRYCSSTRAENNELQITKIRNTVKIPLSWWRNIRMGSASRCCAACGAPNTTANDHVQLQSWPWIMRTSHLCSTRSGINYTCATDGSNRDDCVFCKWTWPGVHYRTRNQILYCRWIHERCNHDLLCACETAVGVTWKTLDRSASSRGTETMDEAMDEDVEHCRADVPFESHNHETRWGRALQKGPSNRFDANTISSWCSLTKINKDASAKRACRRRIGMREQVLTTFRTAVEQCFTVVHCPDKRSSMDATQWADMLAVECEVQTCVHILKRGSEQRVTNPQRETMPITKQYPWDISHGGSDGTPDTIWTRFAGCEIAVLDCAGTSTRTIANAPAFTGKRNDWSRWPAMEENPITAASPRKQAFENRIPQLYLVFALLCKKESTQKWERALKRDENCNTTVDGKYKGRQPVRRGNPLAWSEGLKQRVRMVHGDSDWEVPTSWDYFARHSKRWIRVVGWTNAKLTASWILRLYTRTILNSVQWVTYFQWDLWRCDLFCELCTYIPNTGEWWSHHAYSRHKMRIRSTSLLDVQISNEQKRNQSIKSAWFSAFFMDHFTELVHVRHTQLLVVKKSMRLDERLTCFRLSWFHTEITNTMLFEEVRKNKNI